MPQARWKKHNAQLRVSRTNPSAPKWCLWAKKKKKKAKSCQVQVPVLAPGMWMWHVGSCVDSIPLAPSKNRKGSILNTHEDLCTASSCCARKTSIWLLGVRARLFFAPKSSVGWEWCMHWSLTCAQNHNRHHFSQQIQCSVLEKNTDIPENLALVFAFRGEATI